MQRASFTEQGFPPLYARWLDEAFAVETPPVESLTTCHSCPMLEEATGVMEGATRFSPVSKCCTFLPRMANFLVGGVLLDEDPGIAFGKARLRERIADGVAVSPMGVSRSHIYMSMYGDGSSFGIAAALRCPYHQDDGGCGVWRHREATCSTWFCRHHRGAIGSKYWRILRDLLANVEHDLARWCALELGTPMEALDEVLGIKPMGHKQVQPAAIDPLDKVLEPEIYDGVWLDWLGREEEFYKTCAQMVAGFSWTDVLAHCGTRINLHAIDVRQALQEVLDESVPELLQIRVRKIDKKHEGLYRLDSYSSFDQLVVPEWVDEALGDFDGRPTSEVIAAAQAKGHPLDERLLRKLIDFGVLKALPPPEIG